MSERRKITIDGNEATSSIAFRVSEVASIYPITPSSPMGEFCDEWAAQGRRNIWGQIPDVVEMQSEAGAAGAVHGSLQAGALTTTFTASQGLLLMIPNMYKIAGELTSYTMHVSARTLATHALSIFGDHSDVMSCRQTGFAMLCSNSVQEAHDMALVAHACTLHARIPFMHFFDGFRTSHEVAKIEEMTDDDIRALIDEAKIAEHRDRAMTPDRPVLRGTAQNPDTFFQAREACNGFYNATPQIVQQMMDRLAKQVGRRYRLFDYVGAPDAEHVVILMGSGAEAVDQTVQRLNENHGYNIGAIKVRLYRPFAVEAFIKTLPKTVKSIAVLDRTKEPGAPAEPLHLDVIAALSETAAAGNLPFEMPTVVGGRYGLSSKEFTPAMIKGVYDNLAADQPKNHFTVGIEDDVTGLSLDYDPDFNIESKDIVKAMFYGLGADGTVGANKNSIKIIAGETDNYGQGYFVYDSKKSGAMTVSHLRFGPRPIRSTYLIRKADFVACHLFEFVNKYDILAGAAEGAVFLLNAPYPKDEVWGHLPRETQQQIIDKKLKFYVIDAYTVAREAGMGARINTIMQTCFFAISGVLPRDEAIEKIKSAIKKTYGRKGDEIVQRNYAAVDAALEHMHEIAVPDSVTSTFDRLPIVPDAAPDFTKKVQGVMLAQKGDLLPVSAFPPDGTWPTATTQWEKRNIAVDVPIWDEQFCIQCNKCALVCPHAAIRAKVYEEDQLGGAPSTFRSSDYKTKEFKGLKFTIQLAPEDCTGCKLCVNVCPGKDKSNPKHKAINMTPRLDILEAEAPNYDFFLSIPPIEREKVERIDVKGSQLFEPLFEYSGACTGCGETPYVKLLSQLFGDRLLIGNATGCSSIYGGNLPTTPYCVDSNGRGPTWSNSLFEDAAEFSFGFRLAIDSHKREAERLLAELGPQVGDDLVSAILTADQYGEANIKAQRERVVALAQKLAGINDPRAARLALLADYLVRKSVWALGGDGWAYDIGYGGLDHVLAQDRDFNILVMDTEVYSNTGGQASKATPIGAAAKFASSGKATGKKDLGLMAMNYRHVYVASVAMGAKDLQTVQAFQEADSYPGPSLIIAYSHCIAHGYDLSNGLNQQKLAVDCGIWPLYRYDPRRVDNGVPPLKMDSPTEPKARVSEYMRNETRFRMVEKLDPKRFAALAESAQTFTTQRVSVYEQLAKVTVPSGNGNGKED